VYFWNAIPIYCHTKLGIKYVLDLWNQLKWQNCLKTTISHKTCSINGNILIIGKWIYRILESIYSE
jgi:hypothetical protein